MIRFILFMIICCIVAALCSCSKEQVSRPADYVMVIDQLSLDTSTLYKRYTQDLGILKPQDAARVDTTKDKWYIDCNMLDRLQHLYYLRNGVKIVL